MRTAERAALVGIVVAIGAALRWGFAATAVVNGPLRADAGQYAQYARNLVEHGVYSLASTVPPAPDSFRSPGYPLVLALCRLGGGENGWYGLAIALQVVLGSATVWLCYRLARNWLPFAPSLLAASLCALSPHLVVSSAFVLTECVTTFVLTAGLALATGGGGQRRVALAGAVVGAATLCNETLMVLPLALALLLARSRGWRAALLFAGVALLPMAGWQLRNASQELALRGSARATASISHGSYPGMVFRDPRLRGYPYREDPEQPAFASSWTNLREVLGHRIAADPWRYLAWYAIEKPIWLWRWDLVQGYDVFVYEVGNSPYERQPVMAATHWLMRVLHGPLMLVAAIGAVVLTWNRRRRWPQAAQALGLVAVLGTLAYVPVIPDPRYLQPIRPVVFVLGAASVAAVVRWCLLRRQRPVAAGMDAIDAEAVRG